MKRDRIVKIITSTVQDARDTCIDMDSAIRGAFSDFGLTYDSSIVIDALLEADTAWYERGVL